MGLPQPIYDPEDEEKSLSAREKAEQRWGMAPKPNISDPEELHKEEENPDRTALDKTAEKWGGKPSDTSDGESDDSNEEPDDTEDPNDDLEDRLRSGYESATKKDEKEAGPATKKKGGVSRLRKLFKRKSVWAGAGAGIISIIFAISGILGYLNVFKLGHILDNIDAATFSKFNASFSNRSDKYLKAYINMRLSEIEGSENHDTLLFRANKVDTNNPARDWFRTLRTSNFEQEVFGKQGIRFQSIAVQDSSGGVTLRSAMIDFRDNPDLFQQFNARAGNTNINGRKYVTSGALDADISSFINELDSDSKNSILRVFDGPGNARKEIKKVVKENTHFFQILKRRHIRKDIQNMTGISDWKFFEKTRNRFVASKLRLQQKIIRKVIPDTNAGKFIKCILGAAKCVASNDPNSPENKAGAEAAGEQLSGDEKDTDTTEQLDENGNAVASTDPNAPAGTPEVTPEFNPSGTADELTNTIQVVAKEGAEDTVETIVLSPTQKVVAEQIKSFVGGNIYTKAWSWAKKIAKLHNNIMSSKFSKLVKQARLVQLSAIYATMAISYSQSKSGELTAQEVGNMMEMLDGAEHSEGWLSLTSSNASSASAASKYDGPQTTNQKDYCKLTEPERKKQKIQYFCDSPADSKAAVIEEKYRNSPAFPLLDGVATAVNTVNDSPIGTVLTSISSFADSVVGKVIDPLIKASGLGTKLETVMASAMTNILSYLGAGPMFDGTQAGALNYIIAGSAATSETSVRASGGVTSTAATNRYSNLITANYQKEESENMSTFDRYASLKNPKSLASNAMFSVTTFNLGKRISSIFSNIPSIFTSLFRGTSYASTGTFDASSWAGIDKYDIPQQCQELDPLDPQYLYKSVGATPDSPYATKAQAIIDKVRPNLTRQKQMNADEFWKLIYDELKDNKEQEEIAGAIYNCALFDNRVMGSLGYLSGFSNDGGLGEGSGGSNQATVNCDRSVGNEKIVCAGKTILGVRYANRNEGTGDKWLREWGVSQILGSLGQNPRQWLAERVIGGANDFMECSGYVKTAIYIAYGVTVAAPCSAQYLTDPQFRQIDKSELRAGDLLVESQECGNGGHIGIYLATTSTGRYSSLESSAGVNTDTREKRSGYYERDASDWGYAVRYIGPGSAL